ncbi:hypothetical protein ACIQOV_33050, partial [Kitasatospora sp. NPDC091257]
MADNDDDNVIHFPRTGFAPAPPAPVAEPVVEPDPDPAQTFGPRRRSPWEVVEGLSAPERPLPVVVDPDPTPAGPEPGTVPAAFRSEPTPGPDTAPAPGLGALSAAAVLAAAVAALRGIHSAVTGFRASREQRQAVRDAARTGSESTGATGRGGRGGVQPSYEWGRQSLNRSGGTGGSGGPGGGRFGGGGRSGG